MVLVFMFTFLLCIYSVSEFVFQDLVVQWEVAAEVLVVGGPAAGVVAEVVDLEVTIHVLVIKV